MGVHHTPLRIGKATKRHYPDFQEALFDLAQVSHICYGCERLRPDTRSVYHLARSAAHQWDQGLIARQAPGRHTYRLLTVGAQGCRTLRFKSNDDTSPPVAPLQAKGYGTSDDDRTCTGLRQLAIDHRLRFF